MPMTIPFRPSDNNYALALAISDQPIVIDVHWNSRDDDGAGAWYMDIRTQDEVDIVLGVKIVLGVNLGRRSIHPFMFDHLFIARDSTATGRDPGYDDLGSRVFVDIYTRAEILEAIS